MTPEEREAWYDEHVAPKLWEMGQDCAERGIPFMAVVGYTGRAAESPGLTVCLPAEHAYYFDVLHFAAKCWDEGSFNLDRFCIKLARDAHGQNHSSMVLSLMGVSPTGAK